MKFSNNFYIIVLILGFAFLLSCDLFEPESKAGSIAIKIVPQEEGGPSDGVPADDVLVSVRVTIKKGARSVHNRIYKNISTPFQTEINDLPEGDGYTVILFGRNNLGCITSQAQKDGVRVGADQVTHIEMAWEASLESGTVTDIDGNVYKTAKIGDLWWMMENLKVTHYQNGESIPNVTDAREWDALETGAWCTYDNDPANGETYGLLYNWYAVDDSRKLAPEGWRVPTDEEWKQLEMVLGMSYATADMWGFRGANEGDKLKAIGTRESGTGLWTYPNETATNESCFSALPGGWRIYTGIYYSIYDAAAFWSSTEYGDVRAWSRSLSYRFSRVFRSYGFKGRGFSIRCVKD